jgi:hypothetical protein
VLELDYQGYPVRIYVTCPGRSGGSFLKMAFRRGSILRLRVVSGQGLELLARLITPSFLNRVESGFEDVDKKLLFYSGQESLARSYLSDQSVRNAMLELFDGDWSELTFGKDKIWISRRLIDEDRWGFSKPAEDLTEDLVKTALEKMLVLANRN